VPEGRDGVLWPKDVPGRVAEPQVTAEVAKIFMKRVCVCKSSPDPERHADGRSGWQMNRFFIYEEYGAKYELMIKDVAGTHRAMPGWSSYQKGLEVLASSLSSSDSRDGQSKKALTICDLLVKVSHPQP
jgi:hypothetical protein